MGNEKIFEPLRLNANLTVKNRLFRSSLSGRIDNYDGSGTPARVHFEKMFARGGVGAIISSHAPIDVHGRILPNYATIDRNARVAFWRRVVEEVHACHDCKYILQISHSGRQQDLGGVENFDRVRWSSSGGREPFNGFRCHEMSAEEIGQTIGQFADAARRAQDAGADGVELHSSNGYLFTQFLSSAINRRKDGYGGPRPEQRARFLVEVIGAVRDKVGRDFFLMAKLSAVEHHRAPFFLPFLHGKGNTIEDSIAIARLAVEAGADAIHVSTGSMFPHPRNPAGRLPIEVAQRTYGTLLSNEDYSFYNYLSFRYRVLWPLACWRWEKDSEFIKAGVVQPDLVEGLNLPDARRIKKSLIDHFQGREIPVLCTGGFQHASRIIEALGPDGDGLPAVDGVTMGRTLLANPGLPDRLERGEPGPEKPCTFCNKCLLFVVDHPLGCYDPSRFDSHDQMMETLMAFYEDRDPAGPAADAQRLRPAPRRKPRGSRWRTLFRVKAVWNWALCALFLACYAYAPIKDLLRLPDLTPAGTVYRNLFLSSAAVFGLGFWRVGNAPSQRREVIFLGIIAQIVLFFLLLFHFLHGDIYPLRSITAQHIPGLVVQAIPGLVDLAFAGLFLHVYGALLEVPRDPD